jgi:hypothetical protein
MKYRRGRRVREYWGEHRTPSPEGAAMRNSSKKAGEKSALSPFQKDTLCALSIMNASEFHRTSASTPHQVPRSDSRDPHP